MNDKLDITPKQSSSRPRFTEHEARLLLAALHTYVRQESRADVALANLYEKVAALHARLAAADEGKQ